MFSQGTFLSGETRKHSWMINIRSLRDPKTLGYPADQEVHPQTWLYYENTIFEKNISRHRTSKDSFGYLTFRDYESWWYKILRKANSAVTCEVQRDLLGWFRGTYLSMSFFSGWRARWWNPATSCACDLAFQSTTARRCLQRSLWSLQVWVMAQSWQRCLFLGALFWRVSCSGSSIGRPAAQLAVKKHVRNHAVYQRWQAGQSWHVSSGTSKHQEIHTGKG